MILGFFVKDNLVVPVNGDQQFSDEQMSMLRWLTRRTQDHESVCVKGMWIYVGNYALVGTPC